MSRILVFFRVPRWRRMAVLAAAGALAVCTHAQAQPVKDWDGQSALAAPGKVRITQVWATWCAPCRKEMPEISRWWQRNRKSAAVYGVAIDDAANIQKFLKQTPVAYPIVRYNGSDSTAWLKTQGNNSGALPFTFVEVPGCSYRKNLLGSVDGKLLSSAVAEAKKACLR